MTSKVKIIDAGTNTARGASKEFAHVQLVEGEFNHFVMMYNFVTGEYEPYSKEDILNIDAENAKQLFMQSPELIQMFDIHIDMGKSNVDSLLACLKESVGVTEK